MINFCRNHLGIVKFLASCQVTDTSTKLEIDLVAKLSDARRAAKSFS